MPPPKTGTTSVEMSLMKIGGEPFYWEHPKHLKHSCFMVPQLQDYYVFATVRNPYTLVLSKFQYGNIWRGNPNENTQKNFEKYVLSMPNAGPRRACLHQIKNLSVGFTRKKPKNHIDYKIHSFLKLESLEEDFNKLPFVKQPIKVPHLYKTKQYGLLYTPPMVKRVLRNFRPDFDFFEYEEEIPENLLL